MNTQSFLPLAAVLFVACAGSALLSARSPQARTVVPGATAAVVVEMPVMTVRPDPADLAFYQANRIVDLATVTVHPDAADLAFLAASAERIVDLPAVTVHASADDVRQLAYGTALVVRQLAAR